MQANAETQAARNAQGGTIHPPGFIGPLRENDCISGTPGCGAAEANPEGTLAKADPEDKGCDAACAEAKLDKGVIDANALGNMANNPDQIDDKKAQDLANKLVDQFEKNDTPATQTNGQDGFTPSDTLVGANNGSNGAPDIGRGAIQRPQDAAQARALLASLKPPDDAAVARLLAGGDPNNIPVARLRKYLETRGAWMIAKRARDTAVAAAFTGRSDHIMNGVKTVQSGDADRRAAQAGAQFDLNNPNLTPVKVDGCHTGTAGTLGVKNCS